MDELEKLLKKFETMMAESRTEMEALKAGQETLQKAADERKQADAEQADKLKAFEEAIEAKLAVIDELKILISTTQKNINEVDPAYIDTLEKGGLVFSGKAPDYPIMQILEIPSHPFFMGTQAHPCLTSRPLRPQPMFVGLVAAGRQVAYPDQSLPDGVTAAETLQKTIKSTSKVMETTHGKRKGRQRAKNHIG